MIKKSTLLFIGLIYYINCLAINSSQSPQEIKSVGNITLAFSPNNGVTDLVVKAIDNAKTEILVEAYSFTSDVIAKSLLKAKKRGVDIYIILDKSQVKQKYSSARFFYNQGFINLHIDTKHAIFHNKVMIIDRLNVITGSFNFTKAAETKNAENLLYLQNNPQLAQIYIKEFMYNWQISLPYHVS